MKHMIEKLKKHMEMKGKVPRELDEMEKAAKIKALGGMKGEAEHEMKGRLGGLKKVMVASDSPEGLEKGLDKAKEIVHGAKEMSDEVEAQPEGEEFASEDMSEEESESEESPEDEIAELEKKLAELKSKKMQG